MISEYTKKDTHKILKVINDASLKYKGVIPDDCWQEPYMSEKELINEFIDGVHMYGYQSNDKLIGVIGIQKVKDVIKLIQGKGKIRIKSFNRFKVGEGI